MVRSAWHPVSSKRVRVFGRVQSQGTARRFAAVWGLRRPRPDGGTAVLTLDTLAYGRVEVAAPFDGTVLGKAAGTVSVTARGAPAKYTIDWGVVDGAGWDSLKGDWKALSPTPGGSGKWCAWRAPAPPPC